MATTKPTTKRAASSQTKNTKRPLRAKTANTKTTATKVNRSSARKRTVDYIKQGRTLHIINVFTSVILALYTILAVKATYYAVEVPYMAKDELASSSDTVLVSASRVMFDIDIRWMLVAALGVAAMYSLLVLTRWQNAYNKALSGRIYFWRWVSLAASGAITVKIMALVVGLSNAVAMGLLAGIVMLAAVLGWLGERQNEKANKPVWSAFGAGVFANLLVGASIVSVILATSVYGMVSLPWFVYALAGVAGLGCILTDLNAYLCHRKKNKSADYTYVERNYVLIGLIKRVAFALVLIIGLQG